MTRLQDKYRKEVIPALRKKFDIENVMAVPRVTKVVVNSGTGRLAKDAKMLERVEQDLALLTGQKAAVRKAKKSISSFKLRQGMPVGYAVTLRGKRMYDFLDRLITLALPMSKDFRGIDPKNVDRSGNLNLGIKEHNIFPEITFESLKDIFGLQVTVVTNAGDRERGLELLRLMGVPLQKA
ncbi:MAG TPA: 50S ribosomal protein L5 [Candidatus Paceibacterota bacterium]|nr:50S ribosomal protein L5 [Candidatus Paceibacterota bacterium]